MNKIKSRRRKISHMYEGMSGLLLMINEPQLRVVGFLLSCDQKWNVTQLHLPTWQLGCELTSWWPPGELVSCGRAGVCVELHWTSSVSVNIFSFARKLHQEQQVNSLSQLSNLVPLYVRNFIGFFKVEQLFFHRQHSYSVIIASTQLSIIIYMYLPSSINISTFLGTECTSVPALSVSMVTWANHPVCCSTISS